MADCVVLSRQTATNVDVYNIACHYSIYYLYFLNRYAYFMTSIVSQHRKLALIHQSFIY